MVEEGRMWKVGDGSASRARLECMTQDETVPLAWDEHCNKGHFYRDLEPITSRRLFELGHAVEAKREGRNHKTWAVY
jgi:hypothetical protein